MAVMNMAEEMVDVWKAVFMTYAPAHQALHRNSSPRQ